MRVVTTSEGGFDETTWGKLMSRLEPTPGNHDYEHDPELPYYFLYFVNAGAPGLGYRAWNLGSWRIYALNTELPTDLREGQVSWLEKDLRANYRTRCVLAYFHRPAFSSGQFASPRAQPIFRTLYRFGADLVVTGHEHFFASMPPLTPDGDFFGRVTEAFAHGRGRSFESWAHVGSSCFPARLHGYPQYWVRKVRRVRRVRWVRHIRRDSSGCRRMRMR